MVIRIEIPDAVARKMESILDTMTLPPVKRPDGTVEIRRAFKDIGEFCAGIIGANIAQYLSNTHVDEIDEQLDLQIKSLMEQKQARLRPIGEVESEAPSEGFRAR